MHLTDRDRAMLDGEHGEAVRHSMAGLVRLGEAFDAPDLVDIGYAHVHPGMAMYAQDVELLESMVDLGARVVVPTSSNVTNVDTDQWRETGAPEALARIHRRGVRAQGDLGCAQAMTCTPYWAGHWPSWGMHMTSIESGVTTFCNSVLGARSNRDGFFSLYAAVTGRYPRFGYHLDENRRATHVVHVDAELTSVTDWSCLGYHLGGLVGTGVPVLDGLRARPGLDELDALGAGLATTGGVSMFIVPGVTPPYTSVADALAGTTPAAELRVVRADLDAVYETYRGDDAERPVDFVHLGCPHASLSELRTYARLFEGRKVARGVEVWVTASRAVRAVGDDEGLVAVLREAGARLVTDTCPMTSHFARTTTPDPEVVLQPPWMRFMVVDSAKQAKYVRSMIGCEVHLATPEDAVTAAVTARVPT